MHQNSQPSQETYADGECIVICGPEYSYPTLKTMPSFIKQFNTGNIDKSILSQAKKIYITSEMIISHIIDHISEDKRQIVISLKDKVLFRSKMAKLYPNFKYATITLDELLTYKFDFVASKKYVVKPAKGLYGFGVRIVAETSDLAAMADDLKAELATAIKAYGAAISAEVFMIEEFIESTTVGDFENDEIAIDMFYDQNGTPIITAINSHPLAKKIEYMNLLYYTSARIYETFHKKTVHFFESLKQAFEEIDLKDMPMHAEFKVVNQELIPIEINPMRYGGMGLGEMPLHAFKYHAIQSFFEDKAISLEEIKAGLGDKSFSWISAYNPTKTQPSIEKFLNYLGRDNVLFYNPVDHTKFHAFGVFYVKSSEEKIAEYLQIDTDEILCSNL